MKVIPTNILKGIMFKEEEMRLKTGLTLELLRSPALDVNASHEPCHFKNHDSVPSFVHGQNMEDALMPLHDQLRLHLHWWILEVLPLRCRQHSHGMEDSWRVFDGPKAVQNFIAEHP